MTLLEVHNALRNGKKVYWNNKNYEVRLVENDDYLVQTTLVDGFLLEIIYTPEYFGGLADLEELQECYIGE